MTNPKINTISIVVPTYNERDNVIPLFDELRQVLTAKWDFEVIFVDDSSPDGTVNVLEKLLAIDDRVKIIVRPGKLGLGSAVRDGFMQATGNYWVMMDADLSHKPEYLPQLLSALDHADIALGSRYVPGGGVEDWPFVRQMASRIASGLGRLLVGLAVRDLTTGFAVFRREILEPILPELSPKGFKIAMEIIVKSPRARLVEIPIRFVDRKMGKSKFNLREAILFLKVCFELRRLRNQMWGGNAVGVKGDS